MHELALAQAVVDAALQAAEAAGFARLTKMVIRIGELQQIERECFDFALREVLPRSEPVFRDTEIAIETESALLRCRACEHRFDLAAVRLSRSEEESEAVHFIPELAHAFVRCPQCHSPDFEVVAGRGVTLQTLEGER